MHAFRPIAGLATGLAIWLVAAAAVAAHGAVPAEPPSVATIFLGWTFEPLPTLSILIAICWWSWAVGRVNAAHPTNKVPRRRTGYFLAGMAALSMALLSGIDRYDTTLFSIHMVQHILLILVSAPLLALAAPVTLLLRVSSHDTRRHWILPVLHLEDRPRPDPPDRGVDPVRVGHVGQPLLAAVRRRAGASPGP